MNRIRVSPRTKSFGYVGVLASSVGLVIYLRKRTKHFGFDTVLADSPLYDLSTSHPNLQLKQVQVFFRHGARTPLFALEGYQESSYIKDQHMRPHQLTLFPFDRISAKTHEKVDWSNYEYHLRSRKLLRGGAYRGSLTSFGQEQMYCLGLKIREAYGDKLSLDSYSPDTTYLISTNIGRTTASARCVMAGIFGRDRLRDYASKHGPVKMLVTKEGSNFLIPETDACAVLRNVNHAAVLHFDVDPVLKERRERVEKFIDNQHAKQQKVLAQAQERLNNYFAASSKLAKEKTNHLSFNADRQLYDCDPHLLSLLRDRDAAIDQIANFWPAVISNHPLFAEKLSKSEKDALAYLRRIEVEEFTIKAGKGHRFKFHFDTNPFFHNSTLCKEITPSPTNNSNSNSSSTSKSTAIKWQDGRNLYQQHKSQSQDNKASSTNVSFFQWFTDDVQENHDDIGTALKDEIWKNPCAFTKFVSYADDHSTLKKLNFIALRDDMIARETHGWGYPPDLLPFKDITEKSAVEVFYQAMSGRHRLERSTITRLATGRLLTEIVDKLDDFVKGKSNHRLVLYSSHDSLMLTFLLALGLWDNQWPLFGSDVRLELYQDTESKEHYISLVYNGQVKKACGQDKVLLKLTDFLEAIRPYLIDQQEFDKICASSFLEEVAKDILQHEEGEKQESEESLRKSATPAGM